MLHPYIENATALSDYNEEIATISHFCQSAEMDFQHLTGPRKVSVDLKYDVVFFCACECLCMVYPLESGAETA